jgi:hypothetical protein
MPGRALAFPLDGEAHVDLERCSKDERTSYPFARAMLGREYRRPWVAPVRDRGPADDGETHRDDPFRRVPGRVFRINAAPASEPGRPSG